MTPTLPAPSVVALLAAMLLLCPSGARAQKPGSYPVVPLQVVVESVMTDATPCAICADRDNEPYSDGLDGVAAAFDRWGNLIIDFQTSRSPLRKLSYRYGSDPIYPPDNYFSTIAATPIQSMTRGSEQCVKGVITYASANDASVQYRHYFQRPLTDGFEMSTTSWLVVRRLEADTWEIEPGSAECNTGNPTESHFIESNMKGKGSHRSLGYPAMPFRMALSRK